MSHTTAAVKLNNDQRAKSLFAVLLAILASIFWGAMGVCVQYLFETSDITPLNLVSMRLLLAGILLVALNLVFVRKKMLSVFYAPKAVLGIALSGFEVLFSHLTFFFAIYYSNAGTGAIFLALVPLLAGIYLYLRGKKGFTSIEVLCCVISFLGVVFIVSKGDLTSFDFNWNTVFWGLVSAVFAVIYSIQPKPLIEKYGVEPVVSWGIFAAGIASFIALRPIDAMLSLTPNSWLALGFIVVFGTAAAFWMYLYSLKYLSPVVVGLIVCVEPLSAFLFGVMFMDLHLGLLETLGVIMVLSNVVILSCVPAKPKSAAN
ncbi:DMT family transporter [Parasutterella muris]|uniref:EamA family transporter n=2 Tax=Parasutterella TaxID=577310 RepID=A0A6L6YK16_9BURK|nr:DMT family transporter [Parasutterella muris]MVX57744.1 EamA family transporter [Parasutterella muris]